jgi:hypothetical protein
VSRRIVRLRAEGRPEDDPPLERNIEWILAESIKRNLRVPAVPAFRPFHATQDDGAAFPCEVPSHRVARGALDALAARRASAAGAALGSPSSPPSSALPTSSPASPPLRRWPSASPASPSSTPTSAPTSLALASSPSSPAAPSSPSPPLTPLSSASPWPRWPKLLSSSIAATAPPARSPPSRPTLEPVP